MVRQARLCSAYLFVLSVLFFNSLAVFAASAVHAAGSGVCGRGLAEPPFLSYGVESNLLLLLDNSGSMLDMAYVQDIALSAAGPETPPERQCFDNSFHHYDPLANEPVRYAGIFDPAAWYQWVEGIQQWQHKVYGKDDLVYANGAIYRAQQVSGTVSDSRYLETDTAVQWELLLRPYRRANTHYPANALVLDELTGFVYFSAQGGTSAASTASLAAEGGRDGNVTWVRVRAYTRETSYAQDSLVQWKNRIYRAQNAGVPQGESPLNDQNISWQEVDPYAWQPGASYSAGDIVTFRGMIFKAKATHTAAGATLFEDTFATNWQRLDEGYYEMVPRATAESACTSAPGATGVYSNADLCIAVKEVDILDPWQSSTMLAFAASGNALNWLMSSKFDIQKTILTGGKYEPLAQRLISEGRGCSGSRFVKQMAVQQAGQTFQLTLAVRGSRHEGHPLLIDRIDSRDDTTRIEVLAVSASGYDAEACQEAVNRIVEKGLQGSQNLVDACLAGPVNEASGARSALNHALQYCWQDMNRNMNTIVKDCEDVYAHLPPASIPTFHRAYNCSGVYDAYLEHTQRTGYMGRCWSPVSAAGASCDPAKIPSPTTCTTYPCDFWQDDQLLRNADPAAYTQICTKVNKEQQCQNNNAWRQYYVDSVSGLLCDPKDKKYDTGKEGDNWSGEIDGDPTTSPDSAPKSELNKMSDPAFACVKEAMNEFCSDLVTPQVIDPSDQALSTSSSIGNIPAQLVDSGVMNQLGIDRPMYIMKGYVKQVEPPEGILQQNADNLRIGAMAFNPVGAHTECQDTVGDRIEQYCPAGNQDGARVIAPIRSGLLLDDLGTADRTDERRHVDTVAEAINLTQATTWTPLAEAMYNAIGYYTQNTDLRLNRGDFQTDSEVLAWQPNTPYAAGSYVLQGRDLWQNKIGGISGDVGNISLDGALVWSRVGSYEGTWSNTASYPARTIVQYDNTYYLTVGGGTSLLKADAQAANRIGPHYDEGVVWEPLLDPVVYPCQENHILILTEGASTADINQQVADFVNKGNALTNQQAIDDNKDTNQPQQCAGGFFGSTYFDNLTYFAHDPDNKYALYPEGNATIPASDAPFDEQPKNKLTTHVVVTGSLRDTGKADECNPAVLMQQAALNGGTGTPVLGESPAQLQEQLLAIFNELRQRASAGSAASVISSARGGEGAIYQAVFWPELVRQDTSGKNWSVAWAGDVHGLFLDDNGFMYEDTDFNRTMNPASAQDAGGSDAEGDRRVVIYYDQEKQQSMACYTTSILEVGSEQCTDAKPLMDVRFLWSASDWLSDYPVNDAGARTLDPLDTRTNRSGDKYISNARQRYIFTWSDKNHDGVVDEHEVIPLDESVGEAAWHGLRHDFNASSGSEVVNIINWLRGEDRPGDEGANGNGNSSGNGGIGNAPLQQPMRSRQSTFTAGDSSFASTWRLGDIIHSTPVTVGAPMEGYHQLYNDISYAEFVTKYQARRQVIYFGANDGMLHAVNGGFYSEVEKKFCLVELDDSGTCPADDAAGDVPRLGAELWAYVPYNLQPHLKCLTSPLYSHKYYVDLKPRVFDAQIFSPDDDHPNGWGTILVGGMRLGGAPISAKELNATDTSGRQFISAYFILDITNPEKEPVLLAEMTQVLDANGQAQYADLGYSTVTPTMVVAKDKDKVNKWYLVFGSGPRGKDGVKGVSDQQARVSVFPLGGVVHNVLVDGLVDADNRPIRALRISKDHPVAGDAAGGTFMLPGTSAADADVTGFVADPITVDFDIGSAGRGFYASDAVYFGTVEGTYSAYSDGSSFWNGGGHLYRLVMNRDGHELRASDQKVFDPADWAIKPMLDLSGTYTVTGAGVTPKPTVSGNAIQPISSAPSVGFDGNQYWIYFGTGRFFDADDKTDRQQQSFYGLKEPMQGSTLTWDELELRGIGSREAGQKGLFQTDQILVPEGADARSIQLGCREGRGSERSCFPNDMGSQAPTFDQLEQYIAGIGDCAAQSYKRNCVDGWFYNFYPYENRERNVGQATLLGGLVTFTTYQPYNDVCLAEGNGYLYALHYRTGTSWHENVFGSAGLEEVGGDLFVRHKLGLGRGLSTTLNLYAGSGQQAGEGVKAFVQTSTGEVREIEQENLPIRNYRSGRGRWKEIERP